MGIPSRIAAAVQKLDNAINLGVSAAYPVLFNLPTPEPPPDWKAGVRFAWRVVKATARETAKVLRAHAEIESHCGGWRDEYPDDD